MKKIFTLLIALCSIIGARAQEYVDLGLSVNWAAYNVGATSPYEWGRPYIAGTKATKGKHKIEHKDDISGNPEYDAATANWGKEWRTPTYTEWNELTTSCTWTYEKSKINGKKHYGFRVTGPNGNSIYFENCLFGHSCSTPCNHKYGMWQMIINGQYALWAPGKHPYGKSVFVRPVRDKQ
jgi:hypothetical protein